MDMGLIVTFAGIVVAGLAGVLGVWMERDPQAPPRWAWVFSAFIVIATGIEMTHSVAQSAEDAETEEQTARVLERLSDMAASGTNPALEQFVGAELAAQARANPRVMKRLEKRVAAKGGDPNAIRRKASEGRRAAAGLPKAKAGKAGAAAAGARTGKQPGAGEGKAGAKAPGDGEGKAGGKAPGAEASKVGKTAGEVAPAAADAVGKAAKSLPVPVPAVPALDKAKLPAVPGTGKSGKNEGPSVPSVPGLGGKK